MLIRSQDKKGFINMNTVSQLYVDADNNITVDFNNSDDDGFEVIGEYSTEAKAIKVLDMIQDTYTPSDGEVQAYIDGAIPKVVLDNRVFQMPQESEV